MKLNVLIITLIFSCCIFACNRVRQTGEKQESAGKVLYAELTPAEFRKRLREAPVAYLPLGTLEWHGEHLPLGSDGIQSYEFFKLLAGEAGGIVLPMLFLGPDRMKVEDGKELYGMDWTDHPQDNKYFYDTRQLDGSAYWVPDSAYDQILAGTLKQLSRAGFKIVVAHGHGPSTGRFIQMIPALEETFGMKLMHCWGHQDGEGRGIMVDHAAMNETSLVMALRPELVQMDRLPEDTLQWPVGVAGKDPRIYASPELGHEIIRIQLERMSEMVKEELGKL